MGCLLGPLLADKVIAKLGSDPLKSSVRTFDLRKRYVADIFCVLYSKKRHNQLLNKFNSAHPNVKFATEMELNNEISYLYAQLLRREDGSIR